MMTSNAARFTCSGCGRMYAMKIELAGRKVKCKCGQIMIAPSSLEDEAVSGEYDLADDSLPPAVSKRSQTKLKLAAPSKGGEGAVKLSTNPVARPANVLGYQRPGATPIAGKDGHTIDPLKDHYAPIGLIAGGILVNLIYDLLFRWNGNQSALHIVRQFGIEMVLYTFVLTAVVYAAAWMRGIQLGPFRLAIIKLCAVSVAPNAVGILLAPLFLFIPLGGLLGAAVQFAIFFALLGALFDLEESDTWFIVAVGFFTGVALFVGLTIWAVQATP